MAKTTSTVPALTAALTKRYLRNRVAIFFTVIFPLIFLVIFGGIFRGDSTPSFDIALVKHARNQFADEFVKAGGESKIFKIKEVASVEAAKESLGRGELDAIIELPANFGEIDRSGRPSGRLIAYYDQGDEQLASTLKAVLQGVLDGLNSRFVKTDAPFELQALPIQTANLTRFDYTFAGLLGFSILGLGIFSMANGFTSDKKSGALRRLRVAPIRAWQLIVATAVTRVIVGVMTIAIMFVVALLVFDFNMRGDYLSFLIYTIISVICMFGFGMAIAGWARDDNQAAPIANLVSFPMMFLSGIFFPRFLMPEWLQKLSDYLPLTPINDGFRLILTESKTLLELGPQLSIIAAWSVVIYLIAFRTFKWE